MPNPADRRAWRCRGRTGRRCRPGLRRGLRFSPEPRTASGGCSASANGAQSRRPRSTSSTGNRSSAPTAFALLAIGLLVYEPRAGARRRASLLADARPHRAVFVWLVDTNRKRAMMIAWQAEGALQDSVTGLGNRAKLWADLSGRIRAAPRASRDDAGRARRSRGTTESTPRLRGGRRPAEPRSRSRLADAVRGPARGRLPGRGDPARRPRPRPRPAAWRDHDRRRRRRLPSTTTGWSSCPTAASPCPTRPSAPEAAFEARDASGS